MKYKVTLNKKVYEVEVEAGEAMLVDEYEAKAPVASAPAAPVAVPVAAAALSLKYEGADKAYLLKLSDVVEYE